MLWEPWGKEVFVPGKGDPQTNALGIVWHLVPRINFFFVS